MHRSRVYTVLGPGSVLTLHGPLLSSFSCACAAFGYSQREVSSWMDAELLRGLRHLLPPASLPHFIHHQQAQRMHVMRLTQQAILASRGEVVDPSSLDQVVGCRPDGAVEQKGMAFDCPILTRGGVQLQCRISLVRHSAQFTGEPAKDAGAASDSYACSEAGHTGVVMAFKVLQ